MSRKNESGQALVFAVLALGIVIMGFAGLAVDMGYLRYQKRLQQTAADSAALAGAAELMYSGEEVAVAKNASAANGFTDGTNNVTVTATCPPLSGPHAGTACTPATAGVPGSGYVEVYVAAVQPTFFMRVMGINSETVTARAVAKVASSPECIYTLETSGAGISLAGSGVTLSMPSCGIVDDSDLSVAAGDSISAASIGVYGSATCASCTPTPVTGIIQATDPLAAQLTALGAPPVGSPCIADPNFGAAGGTLTAGTYCSITINGGGTVTFNPGVYVITGTTPPNYPCSLCVSGGSTLNGTGVTFYETGGAISVIGSDTFNFTAPTGMAVSGTNYPGILFWQSSGDTTAADFSGLSSASILQGAFYFPGASITMTGSGPSSQYTLIVAQSLTITGSGVTLPINSNFSSLPSGTSIIQDAVLVE